MPAPIDIKQFAGVLNTDDNNIDIPQVHHKMAYNIKFRGNGNNNRAESVLGNVVIPNGYLPAGDNECIGSFYDGLRQRLIWANCNSNNRHGWYSCDIKTKTVSKLLISFTDSQTDIFDFDLDFPIASINILYTTEDDGDIIHWTDRRNRPMKFNIKDAIDGTYGTNWLVEYLTVARTMPLIAPSCRYSDDSTVLVNNLRKTLYEFRYRYVYKDFTKSTWSPYSKLFAPRDPDDIATDIDPTKNNRIDVVIETGSADCISIEIAARLVISTTFSDNFLVATLDKDDLSINDNSLYTFQFFNDSSYPYIDVNESGLLFSYVPILANTQELLNGNIITYGGITEGVDFNVTLDVSSTVTSVANANGDPITVLSYIAGRNWAFMFLGTPVTGDIITLMITLTYGDGSGSVDYAYDYTVLAGDDAQDIADAFVAAINASSDEVHANNRSDSNGTTGITVLGDDPANFVTGSYIIDYVSLPSVSDVNIAAYKHKSKYRFVLVYFDEYGETNGAQTADEMLITTPELDTTGGTQMKIPSITFSVNHRPPMGAKYFSWARALNLTFQSHIPFVSATTEKETDYAYIEITNLQLNESGFATYDFKDGDRVRIIGQFSSGAAGTVAAYDFPIFDSILAPVINTATKTGTYLKIPYSSVLSNFGTGQHYYCEVYTPAVSTDTNAQTFFEFGETYSIIDPNTSSRLHSGGVQNQVFGTTKDIVAPSTAPTATLNAVAGNLSIGDYYYKVEFVDASGNQSYPSAASTVVTTVGGSQRINLSAIPLGATGVVSRKIYRTIAGGGTFLLLTTIADNTTTVYADNIADASLTSLMPQPAIFTFIRGDVYIRKRAFPITANLQTVNTVWGVFNSVSDLFPSTIIGNGRAFVIDQYAGRKYFPTKLRWGGQYQQNTNVNQTNIFYPLDFDEIDRSRGDIQRFMTEDRLLYVYQNRAVGNYGIYAKYIQNNNGEEQLVTTNDIITASNVKYLQGEHGLGDQYCGLVRSQGAHYFCDPVRGNQVRRAGDGLTVFSDIFKGEYYISKLLIPYNKTQLRVNGSKAKILGFFDYFEGNYHAVLQSGTNDGKTIGNYNFSFNEKHKGYCSFYDFHPEWVTQAEDVTYSWKDGQLYVHDNTTQYCNFYGQQYYPSIKVVFNNQVGLKKKFNSLSYQADNIWQLSDLSVFASGENADAILTSFINPQTGFRQTSRLKDFDFTQFEGLWTAALLRDINSKQNGLEALYEGDYLEGFWAELNFTYKGTDFNYLYIPALKWEISNLNF
jgi:hypothetical protein